MKNKTLRLAFASLLLAISVVLKIYLGIPVSFMGSFVKDINLSPAVIMFSGILMGPMYGGIIGGLTDIIASILRPMGAYVPWFTITNALIGIIPALFWLKNEKKYSFAKVLLVCLLEQTVCSVILNSLILKWLYSLSTELILMRAAGSYVSSVLYAVILYFALNRTSDFFKNKGI